jgi:hypothetical protein
VIGYNAFEHLYHSLFAKPDSIFVMLTAYFDDSGTSDEEPVVAVAGYIGSVALWNIFNKRWRAFLSKHGIKQMHRADLESFYGEFKGWNGPLRTEFVKKAHAIIRECTFAPLGVAIVKSQFDEAFADGTVAQKFGAYAFCVHGALAAIGEWCKAKNVREPIRIVFEKGSKDQELINRNIRILSETPQEKRHPDAYVIQGWSFDDKSVLPLQAADVVAYELYKVIKNEIVDLRQRNVRLSLLDLFRNQDIDLVRFFEKEGFEKLKKESVPGWWTI